MIRAVFLIFISLISVYSTLSQDVSKFNFLSIDSLIKNGDTGLFPTGSLLIINEDSIKAFDSMEFNKNKWQQLYFDIEKSTIQSRRFGQSIVDIHEQSSLFLKKNIIPIQVLSKEINYINKDSLTKLNHEKIDSRHIKSQHIFAASAFQEYSLNGRMQEFILPGSLIFSEEFSGKKLFIDFDDGKGFRKFSPNVPILVTYTSIGTKHCRLKMILTNKIIETKFMFNVQKLVTPNPTATWQIMADSTYLNSASGGEIYVYHGAGHTSLYDPVIIIEGFDIYDSYNWPELYELMNQQNLIEDLIAMGFDALVLNFDDPVTYIQRNAFLVMKLIQMVNDSVNFTKQPFLIGPSMGGLISRYVLNYMEHSGLDHNVRTFLSFDSPQQGANIPLGLQFWIHFFVTESVDAAFLDSRLLSPAAKQMLSYHYTQSNALVGAPDQLFPQLMNELILMGDYPGNTRNVSIINGSGNAANQGYNPADQIVEYEFYSFLVDIIGNCWAIPTISQTTIFNGLIDRPWPFTDNQQTINLNPAFPLDNCPGGYRSSMLELQNQTAPYGSIVAVHHNHCFIPTISSLDIDTNNYFYNAQSDPAILNRTPFDMVYFPTVNEEHIHISPAAKDWIIKEIMHLATDISESTQKTHIDIFPNPSGGHLQVFINQSGRYKVDVIAMDGVSLVSRYIDIKENNRNSTQLIIRHSGLYIIHIEGKNFRYSQRHIVL